MNFADATTLQQSMRDEPFLFVHLALPDEVTPNIFIPEGNVIATLWFCSLLRAEMKADGVAVRESARAGILRRSSYFFAMDDTSLAKGAAIAVAVIQQHAPMFKHMVEIVEAGATDSTRLAELGDGWGDLQRRCESFFSVGAEIDAQMKKAAEDVRRVEAERENAIKLLNDLHRKADAIEQQVDQDRNAADWWKHEDGGETQ